MIGVLIFVVLYVIAAYLYPGGSQADKNAIGFSWVNNYWCNLLNENAINGKPNPGRPMALGGMAVLWLTISSFWLIFPGFIKFNKSVRLVIKISGLLSMTIALFLFTKYHDIVINLASIIGSIAIMGTFAGLYKIKWFTLFWFGIFNLFLVALNNYVYYTKGLIVYLPVIQKISFVSFLIWLCCIDINMYNHQSVRYNVS